jgi:hypothetical protein
VPSAGRRMAPRAGGAVEGRAGAAGGARGDGAGAAASWRGPRTTGRGRPGAAPARAAARAQAGGEPAPSGAGGRGGGSLRWGLGASVRRRTACWSQGRAGGHRATVREAVGGTVGRGGDGTREFQPAGGARVLPRRLGAGPPARASPRQRAALRVARCALRRRGSAHVTAGCAAFEAPNLKVVFGPCRSRRSFARCSAWGGAQLLPARWRLQRRRGGGHWSHSQKEDRMSGSRQRSRARGRGRAAASKNGTRSGVRSPPPPPSGPPPYASRYGRRV